MAVNDFSKIIKNVSGSNLSLSFCYPKKTKKNKQFINCSAVDSGDAGALTSHPNIGGSEKGIEREIDNLLLKAPLDL